MQHYLRYPHIYCALGWLAAADLVKRALVR